MKFIGLWKIGFELRNRLSSYVSNQRIDVIDVMHAFGVSKYHAGPIAQRHECVAITIHSCRVNKKELSNSMIAIVKIMKRYTDTAAERAFYVIQMIWLS